MDVSNVVMTQFTSSAVVVYLMQKVKTAKWFPLVQQGRATLNRIVSVVAAFLVAVGVSWSWSLDKTTGTHTLVITGLSIYAVGHGLWHWLNQFALQETVYQATVNKVSVTTDAAGAIPAQVSPSGAVVIPKEKTV
jgi:hypothetical protein